ncbi:Lrp/AsnC family transcriptional regulator [Streptomyces sp. VTCC 41912]|uniref:Lrp/AsnC family transcriptional regulator n=1 Tax=Streptomyces sp. VTCC 41912 TaxID=3383243 RepID=UPI003896B5E5
MNPAPLDPTDLALVRLLQHDGRTSYETLAARIGLSRAATRARVRRLREDGVVRIVGIVHPAVLGRTVCAHVALAVSSASSGPGSTPTSSPEPRPVRSSATASTPCSPGPCPWASRPSTGSSGSSRSSRPSNGSAGTTPGPRARSSRPSSCSAWPS